MTQLLCWIARAALVPAQGLIPSPQCLGVPHTEHQLVSECVLTVVTDHHGCQSAKAADKALLNSAAVLNNIIALPINTKQNPS